MPGAVFACTSNEVVAIPPPFNCTKPLASTSKAALEKLARPTLDESDAAIACVNCVVIVNVPGMPTTDKGVVPATPIDEKRFQFCAIGEIAPPESPVIVNGGDTPLPSIVTVLPDPLVVIPPVPNISRIFAMGIAVPESVSNSVGICG